jgi:hypothetical protein
MITCPHPPELKKRLDILVASNIIMEEDFRFRRYNKVLDPEGRISIYGLFDNPLFRDDEKEDVTFCIWCETLDSEWRKGLFDSPKERDTDTD